MIRLKRVITSSLKGVVLLSSISMLSACSLFDRTEKPLSYGAVIETDINDLEDGGYYTFNGSEYGKLYIGDRTFSGSGFFTRTGSTGNPERIVWLRNDIQNIPTMRRGDKIVFHSDDELKTELRIERYFDTGYSIGIAGLQKNNNGRYSIDLSNDSLNVNPNSDARNLQKISSNDSVIIEAIGDTPLRSGNVSPSGTVIGLEKGKTYAIDAYLGTNLYRTNVKADVQVLVSSESDIIDEFEFSKSKTIEFKFPNYYNSGYYLVNGYGLVRYLADGKAKENENMDMNVPNIYPKKGEQGEDVAKRDIHAEDFTSIKIKVPKDGEQKLIISYSGQVDASVTPPTAKLITDEGAITLEKEKGDRLSVTTILNKGDYEVQIIGLKGRVFSYKVTDKKEKANNKKTKENEIDEKKSQPEETEEKDTKQEKTTSLADLVNE